MPYNSPRHAEARKLAEAKIPVFPCLVNDRAPVGWLVRNGLKDRTTDPELIDKWWTHGDWNLAIVPEDIGCYVVDLDMKDGKDGLTSWLALCAEHAWAATCSFVVRTPTGGWHLYYRGSLPNSVGTPRRGLANGIDIRGREGYVLVPPSIIDGVEYVPQ